MNRSEVSGSFPGRITPGREQTVATEEEVRRPPPAVTYIHVHVTYIKEKEIYLVQTHIRKTEITGNDAYEIY
jgi:hypothetical protein